ncbi:MAG TPA: hypothetical protein VN641_16240 [Urbifossiella sp.]|nr:hypothetical protein [Urbifossiella sp.]
MQKLFTTAVLASFALLPLGCKDESPRGGQPGTDDTFKLVADSSPNSIKPGDTESVKVTVQRGKDFHKNVRLEAKGPDKVRVTLDRDLVKDGESPDVQVKIHPDGDAAPADYKFTITGTPDNGSPTNLEMTVKVIKK